MIIHLDNIIITLNSELLSHNRKKKQYADLNQHCKMVVLTLTISWQSARFEKWLSPEKSL